MNEKLWGLNNERNNIYMYLLPTGSEERGVLRFGSIPVAILPSRQYIQLLHHNFIEIGIVVS